jgi:hypothetical protein
LIKITAFCSSNEFIGGESTRLIGNLLILSDSISNSPNAFAISIPYIYSHEEWAKYQRDTNCEGYGAW